MKTKDLQLIAAAFFIFTGLAVLFAGGGLTFSLVTIVSGFLVLTSWVLYRRKV